MGDEKPIVGRVKRRGYEVAHESAFSSSFTRRDDRMTTGPVRNLARASRDQR
jgi:hypothetical protein